MSYNFTAYEGQRPYVFVSYAHADINVVMPVLEKMSNEYQYRIWYDSGLHSGDDWSERLTAKIKNSTAFIVFLSANSVSSRHVISEVSIAFENENIKVIPVWITPATELPPNLKYYLSFTQHAFAKNEVPPTIDELVLELENSLPDSTRNIAKVENGVLLSCEDSIHDLILDDGIVELADGVCSNKKHLSKVQFNKKIEKIGNEAFRNCTQLTEIKIPKNVRFLGDNAFRDCVNLKSLHIENEIELGERAFENCRNLCDVKLPSDLKEIYSGLFNSCKSLTHIKLPSSLIAIGDNAFGNCDSLQEIIIPPSVARIDDASFVGCTSLSKVSIPDSVFRMGKNVFKDCSSLKEISLPNNLTKIESGCFRGCTSLETIDISHKNKHYKIFDGVMFNKNKSILFAYPPVKSNEVYEIPDSVSEIADWAFANCNNLKTVIIPDSVQKIGEGAFFRCENLEKIVIPYSVDAIEDTAFRGCENLKEVYIESKPIKELGWGIFYGCSHDLTVYYCSDIVKKYCKNQVFKSEPFTFDEEDE